MSIKVRHQNTLRTITAVKARFGGVVRALRTVKVMQSGQLRIVASFVSELTLSVSGTMNGFQWWSGGPTYNESNTVTASPSGGVAPYSYVWTIDSGSVVSFTNPASATTAVYDTFNLGTRSGIARCTVTDAHGTTAHATCEFLLQNEL